MMDKDEKNMTVQEIAELLTESAYMAIPVDEILTDLMNKLGTDKLIEVIKHMADVWDIE